MNDEYDVVVDEKATKVLNVVFKNSGKSVKITLSDGNEIMVVNHVNTTIQFFDMIIFGMLVFSLTLTIRHFILG